ncbi:hypothetical protein [Nocardioides pacificus]
MSTRLELTEASWEHSQMASIAPKAPKKPIVKGEWESSGRP